MASTPDVGPWWDRHPSELHDLLGAIRARGWRLGTITYSRETESVTVRVDGLPIPPGALTVELGPGFPTTPATVYGPEGPVEHIHPVSANLCLPSRPTVVESLDDAIRLYEVSAADPSAVRAMGPGGAEPRSGFLDSPGRRSLVHDLNLPSGAWGAATITGSVGPGRVHGWIESMTEEPSPAPAAAVTSRLSAALSEAWEPPLRRHSLPWYRTTRRDYPLRAADLLNYWDEHLPTEAAALASMLEAAADPARIGRDAPVRRVVGLVVPEEGPRHDEWHDRLLVILEEASGSAVVPVEEVSGAWSRIPGAAGLADKTVAVAGLGMLGGNTAVHLARGGLGGLRLLDWERVEVGNLLRQPYDVRDLGEAKVTALRRGILRKAPWCAVPRDGCFNTRVANALESRLVRWVEGSDLLLLCTGDVNAELRLSTIARRLGVPVVCGWVGLGIWGAAVVTTRWGISACRWCVEHSYTHAVELTEPPDAEPLFTRGCGHPTFPGHPADGQIVAGFLAKAVTRLLDGPTLPGTLAVVRIEDEGTGFSPETTWQSLPPADSCPICAP